MLSSLVVEYLGAQFKDQQADIPVLCIYLEFKQSALQTLHALIGSLLRQLIEHRGNSLPSEQVMELFADAGRNASGSRPKLEDILDALNAEIDSFQRCAVPLCCFSRHPFHGSNRYYRVVLVLDAFDEAAQDVGPDLLATLEEMQQKFRANTLDRFSIMMTSRPTEADDYGFCSRSTFKCSRCERPDLVLYQHCDDCFGGDFDICPACTEAGQSCYDPSHKLVDFPPELRMDIEATEEDIRNYVIHELDRESQRRASGSKDVRRRPSTRGTTPLGRLLHEHPGVRETIITVIPVRANRMFMLARLYMSSLKVKPGLIEMNDALENLPHGYAGIYEETMARIVNPDLIDPSNADLARRALMWVVCAEQPLSSQQLQDALAVSISRPELQTSYRHSEATLLEVTAGLIQISDRQRSVSMIHLTAFEYLRETHERWFGNASSNMALVCIQYLKQPALSEQCQGINEDRMFDERIAKYPFMAYACQHWGNHAVTAGMSAGNVAVIVDFLKRESQVEALTQAMWYTGGVDTTPWHLRKGANALHICAWFGLVEVMAALVGSHIPTEVRDRKYEQTPLMIACRRGKAAVVVELILSGADLDFTDLDGFDALYEAVKYSNPELVSLLISAGDNLDTSKSYPLHYNRTALMIAAENGDTDCVQSLLQSFRLMVNKQDDQGFTALALACKGKCLNVVGQLMDHKSIDINLQTIVGATCLHLAVETGIDHLAKMLLQGGIDHARKDFEGGATALARAVDQGSLSMVKTLFDHQANIHCRDDRGRGLLHAAAVNGRTSLLPYLVDLGLDPNVVDAQGKLPLHDAARLEDVATVQMLLDLGGDATARDKHGRSPSIVAWENGRTKSLDILEQYTQSQGHKSVDRNIALFPLWAMVKLGHHEQVLAQLDGEGLQTKRKDPDTGNSPLHFAVRGEGHLVVLEKMLEHSAFDINEGNLESRTPLHLAVMENRYDSCSTLLEHGANQECEDRWGATALKIACAEKRWEIALLLIQKGADLARCHVSLTSLLFTAVEYGRTEAVRVLIDQGAGVSSKNLYGQSSLQMALKEANSRAQSDEYDEILQLLRQNKSTYQRPLLLKDHISAPTAFPQPDMIGNEDEITSLPTTIKERQHSIVANVHLKKRVTF